jgi:lipopolysaccharide export system permease protein
VKFARQIVPLKQSLFTLSKENRMPTEMTIRELADHVKRLKDAGQQGTEINELDVPLHQKLSVPFASLVFAMVGVPLGLRPNRSSSSMGLGFSILIIFIYYIAMFDFMALGQSGYLPPPLAAWLPNLLTGGIGVALIIKSSK